jgi:hypothetical protein
VAGTHFYNSGFPLSLTNSAALGGILFNGRSPAFIDSYEGWIVDHDNANWKGSDRYFVPGSAFGAQPNDRAGNATRHNPKARQPWNVTENFSLAKSFPVTESVRMDFRWELFNAFNRFRPNPGSTNVQDPNFGRVQSQLNEPRRMQLGLKIYF